MSASGDEAEAIDLSSLLEEYLAHRRELDSDSLRALEARAGDRVATLREHVALARDLDDLADLLAEGPGGKPAELPRIGRFETLACLGIGGLSEVYLAYDPHLDRQVALKLLQPAAIRIADARDWMTSEGRSLARLAHPGIVQVFDLDQTDGVFYVAMEYVAGPSLREVLDALRSLAGRPCEEPPTPAALRAARALEPLGARCELVLRIARALALCHAQGVVHRDLKPENVLLDERHAPKLIDFGLAHLESAAGTRHTQRLVGTLPYLAPEQVDEGRSGASAASDVFALGVVLYELLTLEHPFQAGTRAAIAAAISAASPPPLRRANPAVPSDVALICAHALERLPRDRYASAEGMAADLEAFLEHRAISVEPPSARRRAVLWLRRNRRSAAAAAATLAVVATLLLLAWAWSERARRAAFRSELELQAVRIPGCERPSEFAALIGDVGWERAEALDASSVARLLFGAVRPDLEALRTRLAARFREVVDPLHEAATRLRHAGRRNEGLKTFCVDWSRAIELYDARLASGDPLPYGGFGTVSLPAGGTLWRYENAAATCFPRLVPVVERSSLDKGFYRYRRDEGGSPCEAEFYVRSYEPGWTLDAIPLDDALDLVRVDDPGGALASDAPDERERAPYLLSRRPVTWREAERVLGAAAVGVREGYRQIGAAVEDPDTPAALPRSHAQAFATRIGGRLPSAAELCRARLDGLVEPAPAGFALEWISLPFGEEGADGFGLHIERPFSETEALCTRLQSFEDDPTSSVCFRVARTAR